MTCHILFHIHMEFTLKVCFVTEVQLTNKPENAPLMPLFYIGSLFVYFTGNITICNIWYLSVHKQCIFKYWFYWEESWRNRIQKLLWRSWCLDASQLHSFIWVRFGEENWDQWLKYWSTILWIFLTWYHVCIIHTKGDK